MLLRSITRHVKDQNWFAVALDFVIVVIGVAVAMMGQQWLTESQQREDMRVAEAALQFDLIQNYSNAKERLAVADCRKDTYQLIAEKLLEQDERWTGMPRLNEPQAFGDSLPDLLRSPNRPWGSRNWETGLARGTFNGMDEERREKYDTIFYATEYAEKIQDDIYSLQGQIKILAVTTIIDSSDRLRYYDMLGEMDSKSGILEDVSAQVIDGIEEIGIGFTVESRKENRDDLDAANKSGPDSYGDCFKPMDWPVLDKYSNSQNAP